MAGRRSTSLFCGTAGCAGVVALVSSLAAVRPASAFFHRDPQVERGDALYAENCASCHGAKLEGAPNWREANPDGTLPPPPHDEIGHTWHHDDAMLFDYVAKGGQAILDGLGVDFVSAMPAFGDRLGEDEIRAVLAYIRSTWPERIQEAQRSRNADR